MRDFLLNEALKRVAGEAAVRFSAMVAGGEQIPFDVVEQAGPDSLFHSYQPLTSRFVAERENEIRALPSYLAARNAVEAAGVAAAFLEACGEPVPTDPAERAGRLLTLFVASLWEGCTEFSLDRERLDRSIEALDAEARDADEAEVLIVPVVGLKMSRASLDLPHGVRLIRADATEAPIEAMRSEGMGRAAWEPQFLAVAEQGEDSESAEQALNQLRELISVMRLFKAGGIGLGPYAFAPTAEGHWSRIPTGAPATRSGGYRLSEKEAQSLAELAIELAARPDPDAALSWAVARFELGCARETATEGLSDHLLALRAVLEGHGPVGASLPMRASALICDQSCDRIEARGRVEAALELERSLMNGAQAKGSTELAGWVEDGVRRLLRDAALGELGADLGTRADETLIASGLAAGDAEIAIAALASSSEAVTAVAAEAGEGEPEAGEEFRVSVLNRPSAPIAHQPGQPAVEGEGYAEDADLPHEEEEMDQQTRIMEPIPAEDEIRITATNWLDEVSVEGSTIEWPAGDGQIGHRERVDTPRVRHLFQVPEDADWEVSELRYDHYGRRAG